MRFLICSLLTLSGFSADFRAAFKPGALAFEARDGQYVSHGPGYALSMNRHGAVLHLAGHAVRMWVAGANPRSSLEALDRMPGKANYLIGRDVRASYDLYGRVCWRDVYPGIDLIFRGNQEHLEYDFEIAAGRDPGRIKLSFEGAGQIRVDRKGDLILQVGAITIRQPKPAAYQIAGAQRRPVDAAFWIDGANRVRFRTGVYDRGRPLVIDPQIVFDHLFGGSGVSGAAGLARDAQGGLYVTGVTDSTDFGTVNAFQSHLGTAPLLVTANAGKNWSYPSLGPGRLVSAIAGAPSAPLVVYAATPAGVFQSGDGGTTWTPKSNTGLAGPATALTVDAGSAATVYAATSQGVFVSTDGAASWRFSMSGLSGAGIAAIAAHPTQPGTVFVSIQDPPALFRSTDFAQTWTQLTLAAPNPPAGPAYAIVFGSNGTVIAATYQSLLISTDGGNTWTAGASQGVQNNQGLAISPGNPGTLYLVNSSGLQRSTDGGKTFAIALPSVQFTYAALVATDPRNPSTVYAADFNLLYRSTDAGQTWSRISLPFNVAPQCLFISPADSRFFLGAFTQNSVFITKWSADGSEVLYSTYLGGSGGDRATGIAVDEYGSAYVTGFTSSPDFPTTKGAFQTKLNSGQDIFAAKLSPDGSQLVYSTLFGSQSASSAAIAVDNTGSAAITGFTTGVFPVTANAFQPALVNGCYLFPSPSMPTSGAAFLTRVSAGGNALVYSTLLGGSCATNGATVALDANGNAWIAGSTESPDFPVTSDALQAKFGGGYYDGFLARFNPSGGLDYATYLGGPGYDALNAIALDPSGNIFVTGESGGLSQPASPGAFQAQASASCVVFYIGPSVYSPQGNAIAMKLDPAAHSILGLTYLGAPLCLAGSSIAVDGAGEPWISGASSGIIAPPTVSPFAIGIGQGFVTKLSADLTQVLFSTYFDQPAGLALDPSGLAYVAGVSTSSQELALTTDPILGLILSSVSGAQQAYIAEIDPTPPAISLDSIVNFATPSDPNFYGIAPGELIRVFGKRMGPASSTPGVVDSGVLANSVAGVQVTFDGTAAPLLSVSGQEIDLIAPFELATKSSTRVQVQYNGVSSNPVQVAVTAEALEILGIFNRDFTANSPSNPAPAGSEMILYASGAGQTNPPSQDGQINAFPLAAPGMPIQIAWVGNDPNNPTILPVIFAGAAPDLAAGILQINFTAPQQSFTNGSLTIGNATTDFNVWVQ